MMKPLFLKNEFAYDGTQLKPLFAYLEHGLLGNSAVAWVGPCDISFDHMVDGEDLREGSAIRGSRMLHFIVEIFDRDLFAGVALQRVMASLARDVIEAKAERRLAGQRLRREGDDLYLVERKLSISIATRSGVSTLMHFAMNVENAGTPVATCALKDDFGLDVLEVATELLKNFATEFNSILQATQKVRPV
jgi:hypothetical protein